jgi:hypothetical protein
MEKMAETKLRVIKPDISFAYLCKDYGDSFYSANYKDVTLAQTLLMFKYSLSHIYPHGRLVSMEISNPFQEFMRVRTMAYRKFREDISGNMVHLDVDIIAYRELPAQFWNQDFDIALVTGQHRYSLMPYSEGMIFSKDTPGAHKFFEDYSNFGKHVPEGMVEGMNSDWWIGQLALHMAYLKSAASKEVKFLILDDKEFCFTPDKPVATSSYFVHFKGPRKSFMKQYLCGLLGTDYINLGLK